MQYRPVVCSALQFIAKHCTAKQSFALFCNSLHSIGMHFYAVHCTAMQCNCMHKMAQLVGPGALDIGAYSPYILAPGAH